MRPGFTWQWTTLPAATLAGLDTPFCLDSSFPRWPPSRVSNCQGHFLLPSWWCILLSAPGLRSLFRCALSPRLRLPSFGRHADFELALPRQRLGFASALWWQRIDLSFVLLRRCLALTPSPPYTQGSSALGFAVMALSALPASSTPAVPLASAGAVSTTGSTLPRLCASMPEGSTDLASGFATVHVSPR